MGRSAAPLYRERMRLSREAIKEYKEIYKKEFGEDLSDAEAEEQALRVLHLFWLLLCPLPQHPERKNFDNSPKAGTMKE